MLDVLAPEWQQLMPPLGEGFNRSVLLNLNRKRIDYFMAHAPVPDWQGVFVADEK